MRLAPLTILLAVALVAPCSPGLADSLTPWILDGQLTIGKVYGTGEQFPVRLCPRRTGDGRWFADTVGSAFATRQNLRLELKEVVVDESPPNWTILSLEFSEGAPWKSARILVTLHGTARSVSGEWTYAVANSDGTSQLWYYALTLHATGPTPFDSTATRDADRPPLSAASGGSTGTGSVDRPSSPAAEDAAPRSAPGASSLEGYLWQLEMDQRERAAQERYWDEVAKTDPELAKFYRDLQDYNTFVKMGIPAIPPMMPPGLLFPGMKRPAPSTPPPPPRVPAPRSPHFSSGEPFDYEGMKLEEEWVRQEVHPKALKIFGLSKALMIDDVPSLAALMRHEGCSPDAFLFPQGQPSDTYVNGPFSLVGHAAAYSSSDCLRYLLTMGARPSDVETRIVEQPLYSVAITGNLRSMLLLMAAKADASVRNMYGHLPEDRARDSHPWAASLLRAYREGDSKITLALKQLPPWESGAAQINRAAGYGDLDAVQTLVAQGVSANAIDGLGFVPLLSVCHDWYVRRWAHKGGVSRPAEMIVALGALGADPNFQHTLGYAPLMFAVESALSVAGLDAMYRVKWGSTQLSSQYAECLDAISALIELGADPTLRDWTGTDAFGWARERPPTRTYMLSDDADGLRKARKLYDQAVNEVIRRLEQAKKHTKGTV